MKQYITIKVFGEDKQKSWKFDYYGNDEIRNGITEFARVLSEKTPSVCLIEEYQPKLTDEEIDKYVKVAYEKHKKESFIFDIYDGLQVTFDNESRINMMWGMNGYEILSFYDKNFIEYDDETKKQFTTLFNKIIES